MTNPTMTLISAQTLVSGSPTVTFSSIPSTYSDLRILISGRSNASQDRTQIYWYFNTDSSGSNYSYRRFIGYDNGSTTQDYLNNSTPSAVGSTAVPGATAGTAIFSNIEIYIPNYTSTTAKSYSMDWISENNNFTSWVLGMNAGLWSGTSAINQIVFTIDGTKNFVAGSNFYLYGIKNS